MTDSGGRCTAGKSPPSCEQTCSLGRDQDRHRVSCLPEQQEQKGSSKDGRFALHAVSPMNTTKFDKLVIASRQAAETTLPPGPPQGQDGQPENTGARHNADAQPPQPGPASPVASQPQQVHVQPQNGGMVQKPAAASGQVQKKKPAAKKRKRDDSQPKRPRGRPRKYPLPPDFHSNMNASRPQAAPLQNAVAPAPLLGALVAATPAPLTNGAPKPSGAEQNGTSQPGMSLYEAWSRNQGAGFLGSPSKQAALYAMQSQQQQMPQAQQQRQQQQQQQGQGQQQQAGQPQEYLDFPPNGFMALMQEYAPALAGAFQDGQLAAFGFPAPSPQPAAQAAASTLTLNPPVINNPQGPLPAFSQADAVRQDALVPPAVVPGLTTRSPSRRKPQKSPIKPQQGSLAGTASPTRMQQALSQGIASSSPARAAASPAGRSRAQRKNAAAPQRVVPGGAASPAAQPASAAAAAAAAASAQQAAAAAPATPEHLHCQAGAAGTTAQQGMAGQEAAAVSKPGRPASPKPSQPDMVEDTSAHGEELSAEGIGYPGLRPSKQPTKMKALVELSKNEPELPGQAITSIPAFHVSQSRARQTRSTRGRKREVSGADAQVHASAAASPAKAAQPQVTGPTEISEAVTVSDHAQPELHISSSAAKRLGEGGEAPTSKRLKALADKQQARSESNASPLTRGSAIANRATHSEPGGPGQTPSPAGMAAIQAMLQAAAAQMQPRPLTSSSALPLRSAGGTGTAPQQAAGGQQAAPQEGAQAGNAAVRGAAAVSEQAAPQPAEAEAVSAAAAQAPASAGPVPALAAAQPIPQPTNPGPAHTAGGTSVAAIAAGSEAAVADAAPAHLPVSQAAVAPVQQGGQAALSTSGVAPDQAASIPERHASPSGTVRSQQASTVAGALKEELNNILLSCLAEEAKRAHAAQEAIEVCRAAEEGLEHLNKQYSLQQKFHTTYAHVVDEVSEALQATSAANRRVQEVQERLNAVQEELKREVAAAELARTHAMTVLRKQATLKEEMEVAREEVSRILHQPQTGLVQLRDTVKAQTDHAGNMRAAKDAAVQSLAQCRQDKDRLLALMNSDPPPTIEALAAAGIRLPIN